MTWRREMRLDGSERRAVSVKVQVCNLTFRKP